MKGICPKSELPLGGHYEVITNVYRVEREGPTYKEVVDHMVGRCKWCGKEERIELPSREAEPPTNWHKSGRYGHNSGGNHVRNSSI